MHFKGILRTAVAAGLLAAGGCIDPAEADLTGDWRGDDGATLVFVPGGRWETTGFDWTKITDAQTVGELQLQSDCTGEWRLVKDIFGGREPVVEITVRTTDAETQEPRTLFFHLEFAGRGFWGGSRPYDLRTHVADGDPDNNNYYTFERTAP